VTTTLPRPLNDSQMIKVKLKRKLVYKGHQLYEWIDPRNVQEALQYLIRHNKWYSDVSINNMWYDENDSDLVQNADVHINENEENNTVECDDSDTEQHDSSENHINMLHDDNDSDLFQNAHIQTVDPGENDFIEQGTAIESENVTIEGGDISGGDVDGEIYE